MRGTADESVTLFFAESREFGKSTLAESETIEEKRLKQETEQEWGGGV